MTNKKNKSKSNLIKCEACGKDISALSDECSSCGEPNDWINPKIEKFLSIDDIDIGKSFTFEYNKTEIWGETDSVKLQPVAWAGVIFLSLVSFSAGIILGLIGTILFYFTIKTTYGVPEEFEADLQNKTWESTNDKLWEPVKSILEL